MAISMHFSEDCVRVIKVDNNSNKIKIKDFYEIEIDKSFIQNGYIRNKIDLTLNLTRFIEENNLKNEDCFLTISTTEIVSKDIILPKTNAKNLHKIVLNKLEELFGTDLSRFYLDYAIVDEFSENKKDFYKIHIYSLPKSMVDDYKSLIKNIGLKPKSLDIPRNFITKALQNCTINDKKIENEVMIFIEMDGSNMGVSLITNSLTTYKRNVNISDELRREKLFKENINNEENTNNEENIANENLLEVAITTDEKLKGTNELTFLDEDDEDNEYDIKDRKYISPLFLKVEEEMYKIIQFAMSLNTGKNINRVFIYGVAENIEEIANYITNNMELPTEKITKLSNFKYPENMDISKFFICATNVLRK